MLDAQTLIRRLISARIATLAEIKGCDASEIAMVQDACGSTLPDDYVHFLKAIGKGAGEFLNDVDIFFPNMLPLTDLTQKVLRRHSDYELVLPQDAFVFSARYGEQFLFFETTSAKTTGPISRFYIDHGRFDVVAQCFWEVIESELNEIEGVFRRRGGNLPEEA